MGKLVKIGAIFFCLESIAFQTAIMAAPLDAENIIEEYGDSISSVPYEDPVFVASPYVRVQSGKREHYVAMGEKVDVLRVFENGDVLISCDEMEGVCKDSDLDDSKVLNESVSYKYISEDTPLYEWPDFEAEKKGFHIANEIVTQIGDLPNGWVKIDDPDWGVGYLPASVLEESDQEENMLYWEGQMLESYSTY